MFYRYFMKVLDSVNEDQNEVELTADGSWKVPEEKQHNKGNLCHRMGAELSADPGVGSLIPARSHTFVEIDHEIISTVILLPSAESFKKGCCQLQAKVCARSTG